MKYPDGSMNSRAIKVEKNLVLIILILFIAIFFIQNASSLTANSSSYSVSMFGTGMATGDSFSASYSSTFLSEAKGTTRNAESSTRTGNVGFFGNTSYHQTVSITSYSISPASAVVGSTIGLSISALNYQSVWAKVIAPNSQEQIVNLINGQTVSYLPNPSIVGRYNVTFYANSSSGAIASAIDYFELTEQAVVTTPPSGGGGGTTIITENCTYVWDCSSWSICFDGKQTRECKNVGTCDGTEGKPIEERVCSDALFDVALKFTNLVIAENNTLKFNVDLTEQGGVEKIDVQVKYSIIDEDNHEVFSQIETRAVQGELNYDKELGELGLKIGEYVLRVDILYGNLQRAFAEQKFEITRKIPEPVPAGKIDSNIFIIAGVLVVLLVLIVFVLMRRKGKKKHLEYKRKVGRNLKRIRAGRLLAVFVGLAAIGLLVMIGFGFTGFAVDNSITEEDEWEILGFVLLIGVFGLAAFLFRSKIKVLFEKVRERIQLKYSKNSLRGIVGKKVYTAGGVRVGNVEEVILKGNRVNSLRIKLSKKIKRLAGNKGIVVKYNCVEGVGQIVIVSDKILEKFGESPQQKV